MNNNVSVNAIHRAITPSDGKATIYIRSVIAGQIIGKIQRRAQLGGFETLFPKLMIGAEGGERAGVLRFILQNGD